jgi:hypothetical protein
MYTAIIATYRGTQRGWEPVTLKTTAQEAERFLTLLNRVRPDYSNKITRVFN